MTYECYFDAYDGLAGADPTIYVTINIMFCDETNEDQKLGGNGTGWIPGGRLRATGGRDQPQHRQCRDKQIVKPRDGRTFPKS